METKPAAVSDQLKCKNCGAVLHFEPGTKHLKCDYCGEVNDIDTTPTVIEAVAYDKFISEAQPYQDTTDAQVVNCKSCGSQTVFDKNVTAGKCPFCASPLVIELTDNQTILRPHYVLPFMVTCDGANDFFKKWMKGLWFAPNDLTEKVNSNASSPLQGVYMPYWLYDTDTTTRYTGQRGEYYYTTETYTETINGKMETRTRQVRHTRWYDTSGTVYCNFENVTVPSSQSLPQDTMIKLGPWDFNQLTNFDERYLSGFRSENFQVTVQDGLQVAEKLMQPQIEDEVRNDIGGDEQRIDSTSTQYNNLGVKYVMLPVWVSSYKYNNKIYQFTVNACTGEVIGQRPYSAIKIILAVLTALAVIALLIIFFSGNQQASY